MPFNILPTKEFQKDFKKLDVFMQKRIKDKIEEVAENPERYKHLHYNLMGSCRLRIVKLRITYSYNVEKQEMLIKGAIPGIRNADVLIWTRKPIVEENKNEA